MQITAAVQMARCLIARLRGGIIEKRSSDAAPTPFRGVL
jgi:hypothetical protein